MRPRYAAASHAACQRLAADRVDDDVGAVAAGQLADRGDEVAVAIVDAVIEPEGLQPLELVVARRGGEHGRTGALGELDGRDADAAGAGVDERRSRPPAAGRTRTGSRRRCRTGSARRRRARDRARRAAPTSAAPARRPARRASRASSRRPRAGPTAQVGDARADLAHQCRRTGSRRCAAGSPCSATRAVQRVAALDADRLDVDEHRRRDRTLGIGDVLVAEHLGTARSRSRPPPSWHGRYPGAASRVDPTCEPIADIPAVV